MGIRGLAVFEMEFFLYKIAGWNSAKTGSENWSFWRGAKIGIIVIKNDFHIYNFLNI